MRRRWLVWASLAVLAFVAGMARAGEGAASAPAAKAGAWKTVFALRFVYLACPAERASGVGGTLRMPIPMPVAGSKARVFVKGFPGRPPVKLAKMAIVKGADEEGKITGPSHAVLFGGKASHVLDAKRGDRSRSDEVAAAITPGVWYLQESYLSAAFPAAMTNFWGYHEAGDQFAKATLKNRIGFRLGATVRVDVYTKDPRPVVACYGDSITRGMKSTIGSGSPYPAALGKLIGGAVVNLGVDGDRILTNVDVCPQVVGDLAGVEKVVFLMGINDILSGSITARKQYVTAARAILQKLRADKRKLKVYWGTMPPAGGPKPYTVPPARDRLRREINAWIRTDLGADGVIDFDAALKDPKNASRLLARYQCGDWLHPSDAGYRKMAATAAKVLKARK